MIDLKKLRSNTENGNECSVDNTTALLNELEAARAEVAACKGVVKQLHDTYLELDDARETIELQDKANHLMQVEIEKLREFVRAYDEWEAILERDESDPNEYDRLYKLRDVARAALEEV